MRKPLIQVIVQNNGGIPPKAHILIKITSYKSRTSQLQFMGTVLDDFRVTEKVKDIIYL